GDPTDSILGFENAIGSFFNDILVGNDNNNRFEGGRGDDTLTGNGGDDVLLGGEGEDILVEQVLQGSTDVRELIVFADHMTGRGNDVFESIEAVRLTGSPF